MALKYLTVDQIIAINADQDGGVGVQNREGVESNAARPQSGFGGQDTFSDLWTKAAAYLHGIASTQYFTDGNKRTAWYSAVTFLRMNDAHVPAVSSIEAEVFVQAVAQTVFDGDGRSDNTIAKSAEWFENTCGLVGLPQRLAGPPTPDPARQHSGTKKMDFPIEQVMQWVTDLDDAARERVYELNIESGITTVLPYVASPKLWLIIGCTDGLLLLAYQSREAMIVPLGDARDTMLAIAKDLSPGVEDLLEMHDFSKPVTAPCPMEARRGPHTPIPVRVPPWVWIMTAPDGFNAVSWDTSAESLEPYVDILVAPMPRTGRAFNL